MPEGRADIIRGENKTGTLNASGREETNVGSKARQEADASLEGEDGDVWTEREEYRGVSRTDVSLDMPEGADAVWTEREE